LCVEPERRLDACFLQAGLSAEGALPLYLSRRKLPPVKSGTIEPLLELRSDLFLLGRMDNRKSPFFAGLLSELRTTSPGQMDCREGKGGVLVTRPGTEGPTTLTFEAAWRIEAFPGKNVKSLSAQQTLGSLTVHLAPAQPGEVDFLLKPPAWASALPPTPAIPRYSE